MRVFVCGNELGLGFVIARRLVSDGHKVSILTRFESLIPNLTKNGLSPVLGEIRDKVPKQMLAKADAVIDAELPPHSLRRRVRIGQLRPVLIRQALAGSNRPLIVTSHAAVLGDTGPIPVTESARANPLRGYAWLRRLEAEVLHGWDAGGVVVRPAWWIHGRGCITPLVVSKLVELAWRFRHGKYIGTGENCFSAIQLDDLADLYCLALEKARPGMLLHAASENLSTKEVADTIHCAMKFRGKPSELSAEQAERYARNLHSLTRSHALSSSLAQERLGWQPSRTSMLEQVEHNASVYAWARRQRIPATECRFK